MSSTSFRLLAVGHGRTEVHNHANKLISNYKSNTPFFALKLLVHVVTSNMTKLLIMSVFFLTQNLRNVLFYNPMILIYINSKNTRITA